MVYHIHGITFTWVIPYTWDTLYIVYLIHGIPEILVILIMKMLVILVYIYNYRIFYYSW